MYPHTALLSRAGSPAPPWVAGSPVAFLVATPWWPPAAALPVWTFCGAQYLGKAATLVPSRWSFARRLTLDTTLEQYVGRLNHDRTTERHWQRLGSHRATVPKKVPCGSPRHVSKGSCCAIIICPFAWWRSTRMGRGLSLGPLPLRTACRRHRRIAPTAQYRRRCARRPGLVKPRDPSWCPVTPLFRRAARCWPSAGLSRGWPARVSSSHTWEACMWSAIAGAQGTGACSRLSPPVPGSRSEQGSHLPYTPRDRLR